MFTCSFSECENEFIGIEFENFVVDKTYKHHRAWYFVEASEDDIELAKASAGYLKFLFEGTVYWCSYSIDYGLDAPTPKIKWETHKKIAPFYQINPFATLSAEL